MYHYQFHKLYEAILDRELDKRNFRRKMLKLKLVESLDEKQAGVPHKPSQYFKFNEENYNKLLQNGYDNFGFWVLNILTVWKKHKYLV